MFNKNVGAAGATVSILSTDLLTDHVLPALSVKVKLYVPFEETIYVHVYPDGHAHEINCAMDGSEPFTSSNLGSYQYCLSVVEVE